MKENKTLLLMRHTDRHFRVKSSTKYAFIKAFSFSFKYVI